MSTSKTSERSWIEQVNRAYLKPFVAWGTGFARRYRSDIFYRTGWNVVLLQVGLTLVLIALVAFALSSLYEEVVVSLIQAFSDAIRMKSFNSLDTTLLIDTLEYTKNKNMVIVGSGILMLAATFGYLITRLALAPAHKALESQKQFIGNVAHELRTPLSILKTDTEVALLGNKLSPETRETLESNIEELDRISNIINNLLSMNRLLRPEKIVFEPIDINDAIEHTVRTLKKLAEKKKVQVLVVEETIVPVMGNASGIEQILLNVVKNAINHTPAGGTVRIEAKTTVFGRVEITITDTGVGIPEKDLEHIFEPFYRGDKSRARTGGTGSGLGLAIVSELVKIHHGRIGIVSEEGRGTEVTITLRAGTKKAETPRPGEIAIDFLGRR